MIWVHGTDEVAPRAGTRVRKKREETDANTEGEQRKNGIYKHGNKCVTSGKTMCGKG